MCRSLECMVPKSCMVSVTMFFLPLSHVYTAAFKLVPYNITPRTCMMQISLHSQLCTMQLTVRIDWKFSGVLSLQSSCAKNWSSALRLKMTISGQSLPSSLTTVSSYVMGGLLGGSGYTRDTAVSTRATLSLGGRTGSSFLDSTGNQGRDGSFLLKRHPCQSFGVKRQNQEADNTWDCLA